MKKYICAAILLVAATTTTYAGEHKAGANNSCFYDSKHSDGKWHYYFCGKYGRKDVCAGKTAGGKHRNTDDTVIESRHLDVFTFTTDNKDTYCCCGGTDTEVGRYVKATNNTNCYTNDKPTETIKPLGNGTACKRLTYKTVCGDTVTVDCDTPSPETCAAGYIWRNGTCTQICSGDTVYESEASNVCAACETSPHQGISKDKQYCKKCDKDTEFFNRKTKECVLKDNMKQLSTDGMKKCWQCSGPETYKECVKAVSTGTTLSETLKTNCRIK